MTSEPIPLRAHADVPDVAGDHLNAQRFLAAHQHEVIRSPELGSWFLWNESRWVLDRLDRVPELAAAIVDGLRQWVAEATGDEHKRRSAHYAASAKAGRTKALLDVAGTHRDIVVAVEQLDSDPMALACRNGTVDLRTGELRPADPADLITRGVDVDFDPDARSAELDRFLATIFADDAELIAYVQRLLGYCITGVVEDHILAVLFGLGANGKSTLTGVLQELLGDLAITAPEGLVIQRRHQAHAERLAVLRGRRLVVSAELEDSAVLDEGVIKMLTGGDTISPRELYSHRFNFRPTHKLLLVTNHRPRVHGVDEAIWRRLRVVPFDVTIPPEDQDRTLRRRLLDEHGSAVLAWLVRGAVAWHREGMGTAAAVVEATDEYRHTQDRLSAWLDECTERIDTERTKCGELYESWKVWCSPDSSPGRTQDFVAALKAHGITVETKGRNSRARGITLKVRAGEGSSRTSPISGPTRTLRMSPHEPSSPQVEAPPPTDDELLRMFGAEG